MTQIKIKLEFERWGYTLLAFLNPEKAPKTVEEVVKVLPISIEAVQSRWCGREISWGIKTNSLPPKENSTGIVSKFDITYWRPWVKMKRHQNQNHLSRWHFIMVQKSQAITTEP